MTIGNALTFIDRGLEDKELRMLLNAASSPLELNQILDRNNLTFSSQEFSEAFNNRLTKCQIEEDAEQIKEFKMWWDLVCQHLEPVSCDSSCGGCRG